jgi:hypothetical protein
MKLENARRARSGIVYLAFTSPAVIGDRITRFQSERLAAIRGGTVLPAGSPPAGDCLYVRHVLPFAAFSGGGFVDLWEIDRDPTVRSLISREQSRLKYDLDGVLFYHANQPGRALTVFRDGRVEVVGWPPRNQTPPRTIFEIDFENRIIDLLPSLFAIQQRLGTSSPLSICLSFISIAGLELNIHSDLKCQCINPIRVSGNHNLLAKRGKRRSWPRWQPNPSS